MPNKIFVEKFQHRLGCGAVVTRFRETIFDTDEDEEDLQNGCYFKDKLWDEEN